MCSGLLGAEFLVATLASISDGTQLGTRSGGAAGLGGGEESSRRLLQVVDLLMEIVAIFPDIGLRTGLPAFRLLFERICGDVRHIVETLGVR